MKTFKQFINESLNPFPESVEKGIFYHGTPHGDFDIFDITKRGEGADQDSFGDFGNGFYFTKDKSDAEGYAKGLTKEKIGDNPYIIFVYLDIRKPFDFRKSIIYNNSIGNAMKLTDDLFYDSLKKAGMTEEELELMNDIEGDMGDNWGDWDIASKLKDFGYDSIISHDGSEYVVFDNTQIKKIKSESL